MKKSLLAIATLSAIAGTAHADDGLFSFSKGDTTLSLYGVLDAAVVSQNHALSFNNTLPNQSYSYAKTFANAPSRTGAVNGGLSDSRWGIKGSTGLFGDTKAIFNFESGFDITNMKLNNAAKSLAQNSGVGASAQQSMNADSSLNGGMFDRAAWAGIQGSWGTLTYGTQNNPVKDAIGAYDPVKSDTFSPFGESGTVGGGVGSSEQSRMHHSVKYTNKFGNGFDMSLAYQFGNDVTSSWGNTYAARVGYENGPFGLTAAYSSSKDAVVAGNNTNAGSFGTIKLNIYDVSGYVLAGKYKPVSDATIEAGYEHFQRKAPGDGGVRAVGSLWSIPVYNGATAGTTVAGFGAGISQNFNIFFLGGDYNIMPALNLAVGYYNTKADPRSDNPVAGNTDYKIDTWSAVLKYAFTKSLDLYAAVTANKFGGGAYTAPAAASAGVMPATNVTAYGLGARFKF